jgi:hypothetical protein
MRWMRANCALTHPPDPPPNLIIALCEPAAGAIVVLTSFTAYASRRAGYNVHVLVARPVIFNLAEVVRRMITTYGSGVDPAKIAIFIEQNNKNKEVVSSVSEKLAVPVANSI